MQSLNDKVEKLPKIGPKRLEALHALNIFTIRDLLHHFPFRYDDIQVKNLVELIDQDKVSLKGTILTAPVVNYYGGKKNRLSFKMAIDSSVITVVFFNQHYLKNRLIPGETIAIYGKWEEKKQQLLGMKLLGTSSDKQFEAIYHANQSIKQSTLFQLIKLAFELYQDVIIEFLPSEIIEKYQLISYQQAIKDMHFPENTVHYEQARKRLIYQELFVYQLQLMFLQKQRRMTRSTPLQYDNDLLKLYIQKIPFELTNAQKRVTNTICKDLLKPYAMNRLLQGDVGSGKTVVASIGIYATFLAGFQSALMVPTEILAMQHFDTLKALFDGFEVNIALLTSSTSTKERNALLNQLKVGELDIVIGTHALFQDDVLFSNLGLIIIDEQHRFGVNQRRLLEEKASLKNVLYMSATPIPRTLTMTLYGQMDISILDELPANRVPIKTTWVKDKEFEKVVRFIKSEIKKNKQAYVITPLIDESSESDLKNAYEMCENLSLLLGDDIAVGLLHGRMKQSEKDEVMSQFSDNNINVLVSTTVIEVGVNVPNATVMVIQDAERFGLAQLHQLRGRVGRGDQQSYCILIGNPNTEQGKLRLQIMTQSNDGFYLSEKDLEMRGSGDLFGTQQSGLPTFRIANIISDRKWLEIAREDAKDFVIHQKIETNHLLKEIVFDSMALTNYN